MLVQTTLTDVLTGTKWSGGIALCAKCGKEVGPLSREEITAIISGRYGDVLCFECEDFPPQPFSQIPKGQQRKLLAAFGFKRLGLLPVHAWNGWTNDRYDVTLQNSPNFGWCFWLLSPDERRWTLRRVRMSPSEATSIRDSYCMMPIQLK